ncbi:MAG: LD-carboxypeptidase [Candidatus Electrothrix sp. GW3-4]|uniref:S66 peptidase family protein n=1 Tax=Candidatus Electrothrix sp. GW3-4 TaxID=3126740 RepID=UPI0030CC69AA
MSLPVLPSRLHPGDTIAVIYPAGPVRDQARLANGLQVLRDLNLRIRHYPLDGSGPEYLAADDEQRIQNLYRLWNDEEVKALIAARGGYGCLRIIGKMNPDLLRSRPKWLIGFSDLTVLLNGIFAATGLVTLHGPMVTTLADTDQLSFQCFKEALNNTFQPLAPTKDLEILRSGNGQGRLAGGNLTTLTHLLGTPWQPQLSGRILFLEDTGEPLYKLDRMLTHLACCGLLDNLAGLILGVFDPGQYDRLEILRLNEQVWSRALELTQGASYPLWGGFPLGHQHGNVALPIGMEAVMDSTNGTLSFLPQSCQVG